MKRSTVKRSAVSAARARALESIPVWTEEQIESVMEEPANVEAVGETMEAKIERVNRRKKYINFT